jgi:RNA polymerase sigma-70 factor (sigma-E family)
MMSLVQTDRGSELADLYRAHYRPLVRLAALLLDDVPAAEEVVQDAFVQLHREWARVNDEAKRPAYLRSIVMNGARSRARRRATGRRLEVVPAARFDESAETSALQHENRREVLAALRALPDRQRECLMLRYYLDLHEAEIAATLGISAGSVKTHTHRGIAALERALEATR